MYFGKFEYAKAMGQLSAELKILVPVGSADS